VDGGGGGAVVVVVVLVVVVVRSVAYLIGDGRIGSGSGAFAEAIKPVPRMVTLVIATRMLLIDRLMVASFSRPPQPPIGSPAIFDGRTKGFPN